MTGYEAYSLAGLFEGALQSLLGCAVGVAAWWVMFRAPLGRRKFRTAVHIRAPVEKIWSRFPLEPAPPRGGGAGPLGEPAWRIRRVAPHAFLECEQIEPPGADADAAVTRRLRLTPQGETVLVEEEMRRLVRGVFGHLYIPQANRRFFERLRADCEGRDATRPAAAVSRRARALLSALAFAVVVAFLGGFDPEVWGSAAFVAAFLQIAVWLHEYGHLLAMRWFGHAEATFVLVPFLGGAAIKARPSTSRFEEATIALMGPALSGGAVLLLTPLAPWGLRFFVDGAGQSAVLDWSDPEALTTWAGLCAIVFLAIAIPLNLYNLAPLGMLDGGRAVAALARGRASRALLATAVFAALAFAFQRCAGARDLGAALAFIAVVWLVSRFAAEEAQEELAPMNWRQAAATTALLVGTLAIYVDASRSLMPTFLSALAAGVESPLEPKSVQTASP